MDSKSLISYNVDDITACLKYDSYHKRYKESYKNKFNQIDNIKKKIITEINIGNSINIDLVKKYNILINMEKIIKETKLYDVSKNKFRRKASEAIKNGQTLTYFITNTQDKDFINGLKKIVGKLI